MLYLVVLRCADLDQSTYLNDGRPSPEPSWRFAADLLRGAAVYE